MACLCSLLHVRLETAPDLPMDGDWLEVAQRFVAEHNYWMLFIPADWERIIHPSVHYLATGLSPRGPWMHSVIKRRGEVVHDPAPPGGGIGKIRDLVVLVWRS